MRERDAKKPKVSLRLGGSRKPGSTVTVTATAPAGAGPRRTPGAISHAVRLAARCSRCANVYEADQYTITQPSTPEEQELTIDWVEFVPAEGAVSGVACPRCSSRGVLLGGKLLAFYKEATQVFSTVGLSAAELEALRRIARESVGASVRRKRELAKQAPAPVRGLFRRAVKNKDTIHLLILALELALVLKTGCPAEPRVANQVPAIAPSIALVQPNPTPPGPVTSPPPAEQAPSPAAPLPPLVTPAEGPGDDDKGTDGE